MSRDSTIISTKPTPSTGYCKLPCHTVTGLRNVPPHIIAAQYATTAASKRQGHSPRLPRLKVMASLPLLRGRITLSDALDDDCDILKALLLPKKRLSLWIHLYQSRPQIEAIVARHLRLSRKDFHLADVKQWIHGSFNVCILVHIAPGRRTARLPPKIIIRFPLPYKIGGDFQTGNIDEKLRCEAATYVWLNRHCPTIPTARLLGFGFPGGISFTRRDYCSFFDRIKWHLGNCVAYLLRRPRPLVYVRHKRKQILDSGYLLLEFVQESNMLADSWDTHQSDPVRRATLFRALSRIILQIASHPLPRIGSWTMDDRGRLSLANRPLTMALHQQESQSVPTGIPRDQTYTCAASYYLDLLACRDNVVAHQPNAVRSDDHGRTLLAALAAMRALLPTFSERSQRDGPFVLSLTDLHPNNIFVDDNWNITRIIDLEWASVLPQEMMSPPAWLSSLSPGDAQAERLDAYALLYAEFVRQFELEEHELLNDSAKTQTLRRLWDTGAFWYFRALDTPAALPGAFTDQLQPRFISAHSSRRDFDRAVAPLWDERANEFLAAKVAENRQYEENVRDAFRAADSKDKDREEKEEKYTHSTKDTKEKERKEKKRSRRDKDRSGPSR